jgi:hypothetical protein
MKADGQHGELIPRPVGQQIFAIAPPATRHRMLIPIAPSRKPIDMNLPFYFRRCSKSDPRWRWWICWYVKTAV